MYLLKSQPCKAIKDLTACAKREKKKSIPNNHEATPAPRTCEVQSAAAPRTGLLLIVLKGVETRSRTPRGSVCRGDRSGQRDDGRSKLSSGRLSALAEEKRYLPLLRSLVGAQVSRCHPYSPELLSTLLHTYPKGSDLLQDQPKASVPWKPGCSTRVLRQSCPGLSEGFLSASHSVPKHTEGKTVFTGKTAYCFGTRVYNTKLLQCGTDARELLKSRRYNTSDTKLKFNSIVESHIQETFTGEPSK